VGFAVGLNVQAKAWTYLRDNRKDKATAHTYAKDDNFENAKADPPPSVKDDNFKTG
jgi:hypothetical protein